MKEETRIFELLSEVLQKQDSQAKEQTEFRSAVDKRFDALEAQSRKHEWQQNDLSQKLDDVRYELVRQDEETDGRFKSFTNAVLTVIELQRNLERRVMRLEKPDEPSPGSAAA